MACMVVASHPRETHAMYRALDIFFFVFHSVLVLLIVFGWLWKRTRKANLAMILLTAFSWGVLGFWYGFGYCPCTDWHWQVRLKLGHTNMPFSYIKFLIDAPTGWDVNATLVNVLTVTVFAIAFGASAYLNVADFRRRRRR